jgi:hypothetical protein
MIVMASCGAEGINDPTFRVRFKSRYNSSLRK